MSDFSLFFVCPPGLESVLAEEACAAGFSNATPAKGGVEARGDWAEVARANLVLRGATRILVRLASFRAMHPAQLDKRARKLPWVDWLRPDVQVRVDATCRASKIYHAGAARDRVLGAITDQVGAPAGEDGIRLMVRIEDDLVTISLDSSGAPLHQRGHKQAVGKAPLRESLAALMLRQCGYEGRESVLDPMCGSGTFVIEAAEIALGMTPGRSRNFAWEQLAVAIPRPEFPAPRDTALRFFGADRDAGAVAGAMQNAARAGVSARTSFAQQSISALERPDGPPGLIMVNPPYGGRIGNRKLLYGLYATLGTLFKERFTGWRIGLVTSEPGLAKTTGIDWLPPGPVIPHGGLKVRLYRSDPL